MFNRESAVVKHTKWDFSLYNLSLNCCCVGVQSLNFTISHFQGTDCDDVNSGLWLHYRIKNGIWRVRESTYLKTNISSKSERKAYNSMYSVFNLKFGNNAFILIIQHFMIQSGVTEEDDETVRIHYERQDKSRRHMVTCSSIVLM